MNIEAEFHKAIKHRLSKRDQGHVMGAFRAALVAQEEKYKTRLTEVYQELSKEKEYCCCGECLSLTPSTVSEREALQHRIRELEKPEQGGLK